MCLLAHAQRSNLLSLVNSKIASEYQITKIRKKTKEEGLDSGDKSLMDTFVSGQDANSLEHSIIAQVLGISIPAQGPVQPPSVDMIQLSNAPREHLKHIDKGGTNLHLQSCGHTCHLECFKKYTESISSDADRQHSYRDHLLNTNDKEFFCPLCRRIGNILIPLIPDKLLQGLEGDKCIIKEDLDGLLFDWLNALRTGESLPSLEDPAVAPFATSLDNIASRLYYSLTRHDTSSTALLSSFLLYFLATDISFHEMELRGTKLDNNHVSIIQQAKTESKLLLRAAYKTVFAFITMSEAHLIREISSGIIDMLIQPKAIILKMDLFNIFVHWQMLQQQQLLPHNIYLMIRIFCIVHLIQNIMSIWSSCTIQVRKKWMEQCVLTQYKDIYISLWIANVCW